MTEESWARVEHKTSRGRQAGRDVSHSLDGDDERHVTGSVIRRQAVPNCGRRVRKAPTRENDERKCLLFSSQAIVCSCSISYGGFSFS